MRREEQRGEKRGRVMGTMGWWVALAGLVAPAMTLRQGLSHTMWHFQYAAEAMHTLCALQLIFT